MGGRDGLLTLINLPVHLVHFLKPFSPAFAAQPSDDCNTARFYRVHRMASLLATVHKPPFKGYTQRKRLMLGEYNSSRHCHLPFLPREQSGQPRQQTLALRLFPTGKLQSSFLSKWQRVSSEPQALIDFTDR